MVVMAFLDGANLCLEPQNIGAVFAHHAGCWRHLGKGGVTDTIARGCSGAFRRRDVGVASILQR